MKNLICSENIVKNRYGFYELKNKPDQISLKEYYEKCYFQNSKGTYKQHYSKDEIKFKLNKVEQKLLFTMNISNSMQMRIFDNKGNRFLDVGSGEGWAMSFMKSKGWEVLGLDYSSYGCKVHNPNMLDNMRVGDINDSLKELIQKDNKYDLILLDNVMEHIIDPLSFLKKLKSIMHSNTILIIEVPNDFSLIQLFLLEKGLIDKPFWIVDPDHINYFNHDGLKNICSVAGFIEKGCMTDFPIDFALFNEATNYVKNKEIGKSVHLARVAIENLIHNTSPEKANEFYQSLAALGMGRTIISFYTKKTR